MPDELDRVQEKIDKELDDRIKAVTAKADLPPGKPGDCELCGEWSGRLIDGACAPCRDHFNLP
jgi:hypothetical protein